MHLEHTLVESIYIYIYIYIERERERERESFIVLSRLPHDFNVILLFKLLKEFFFWVALSKVYQEVTNDFLH